MKFKAEAFFNREGPLPPGCVRTTGGGPEDEADEAMPTRFQNELPMSQISPI